MFVQKNREKNAADLSANQRGKELLAEIEEAIRAGNKQQAYELSLQATKAAPENIEAWFLRATLSPSLEERVFCVNCLNELSPDREDRHNVAFSAIKELLDKDPFLAYVEETEALYRVMHKNNLVLVIPKKRAPVNPSPREEPGPLKPAYQLLLIATLGLLLAGIGTLIFAPLAALAALQIGPSLRTPAERVSSTIVLILASLLFLVGLAFGILFLLHVIG